MIQSRSLLDTVIPLPFSGWAYRRARELFARAFLRLSGDFLVIALGEWSEGNDTSVGYAFLIPKVRNESVLNRIETKLSNLNFGGNGHSIDLFQYQNLADFLSEVSVGAVSFEICRSGKVFIDSSHHTSDAIGRDLDRTLSNQCYYFLKDCYHRHQHHDPSQDALISLVPVEDKNDETWALKVQHRLFRHIIRFKRFGDHRTLFRASGVLAYAKAFYNSFKDYPKMKVFHTDELEQSLTVRREEVQHFDQLRLNKQHTFSTYFFSLTAFVLSAAVLAQLDKAFELSASVLVEWTTRNVSEYPIAAVGVIWIISKLLQFRTFRESPHDWPIVRNVYQLFRSSSLGVFVTVLVALSAIVFLCALYLAWIALGSS